jgi:hypothetical protein
MVFVYFAFWGLQEEFSTLPCSPRFLHNFGCCYIILMRHKNSKDVIKIKKNVFFTQRKYYMLRFVQIRNNRYENRFGDPQYAHIHSIDMCRPWRMLDTSAPGKFGTRTLRHLCETFRHQDSSVPDNSALVFFSLILQILSYRIFIYNWGEMFVLRTLNIRYMQVFCLFTLGRHGNFTAGVTMEQPDLLCIALALNIEFNQRPL